MLESDWTSPLWSAAIAPRTIRSFHMILGRIARQVMGSVTRSATHDNHAWHTNIAR